MARPSPDAPRPARRGSHDSRGRSDHREWLVAGVVGRAHGLDGSFHVRRPKPQLLALGMTVTVASHQRVITRRAGTDSRPILSLDGCDDRAGAEALRGEELLTVRSAAPALGPDEWWAEELEGCSVHDGPRRVGTVRRLVAWPSCEALEVARDDHTELLVPLVSDAVRSVDVERREIEIDLSFLSSG